MPAQTPDLTGSWEKCTSSPCSQVYPDMIRFQPNGQYVGQKSAPGMFSIWDVGTFEVMDDRQVNLSTANDAVITYAYSLSNDMLTFTDPDGCEFRFERAVPGAGLK